MFWEVRPRRGPQRVCRALRSSWLLAALLLTVIPAAAGAATANVTFTLPADRDIDFFRVYVGSTSKRYDRSFDLREPAIGPNGRAMAMQQQLASLISAPGLFFLAMTTVDTKGQESAFSNEITIDMRGSDSDLDGIPDRLDNCPRMANADQSDRGGISSPADPGGTRRDGIGDACQCGDLDGSGTVTVEDAKVVDVLGVLAALLGFAGGTLSVPETCNVAGTVGCDPSDAQAIRLAVMGRGSLQQSCVAATRPARDQTR